MHSKPDMEIVRKIVAAALAEDGASDDVTVAFTGIGDEQLAVRLLAMAPGVLCGMDVVEAVFRETDPDIRVEAVLADGDRLEEGAVIARIDGGARGILAGERVALNFLQRLSGVATLTARFVEQVAGTGVAILDTRKTTPLLRSLEKYAVLTGGGGNHRFNLSDMILIKDNHILAAGGIESLLSRIKTARAPVAVELEVDSLDCFEQALGAPIDRVMLDNFTPDQVRQAVERIRDYAADHPGFKLEVEVSGGITLDSIRDYTVDGVDFISVGALTHSAPGLDMSIEVA